MKELTKCGLNRCAYTTQFLESLGYQEVSAKVLSLISGKVGKLLSISLELNQTYLKVSALLKQPLEFQLDICQMSETNKVISCM